MPPFFDGFQLQNAITARAVPALELLAEHPNHLERALDRRFDRDDPPPYESSTESEEEEALRHPVLAHTEDAVLEEFHDRISEPLSDREVENVLDTLDHGGLYTPGKRFLNEARREHEVLTSFYRSEKANQHTYEYTKGPKGRQRCAIIVRHNIRKRWERLGIWNPEWGIPGRVNKKPNDETTTWKWKWQSDTDPPSSDPQHPVSRAIELRRGLDYGGHVPPPPRSRLRDDSSASEAESFIISRPWFLFSVERVEFRERKFRIPMNQWGRRDDEDDDPVRKWWKERGDWEEDWEVPGNRERPVPGWKWRHESPSPEPEDLAPLNTDEMDFTPSEVDALEAVPPDTPPKPKPVRTGPPKPVWGFGIPGAPGYIPPEGPAAIDPPGYTPMDGSSETEDEPMPDSEQKPPNSTPRRGGRPVQPTPPSVRRSRPEPPYPRPRRGGRPEQPLPASVRRGRPRKQTPPSEDAPLPAPAPLVRRSARIAARNANPAPPPPPPPPPTAAAVPSTRTRKPRGPPAAPPPRASRSTADAPKKRGRPRKVQDSGIMKPAAPPTKKGRKLNSRVAAAAAASTASDEEGKKSTPVAGKRGRGRPRRTQ